MKNGNYPAFPNQPFNTERGGVDFPYNGYGCGGISARDYIAIKLLSAQVQYEGMEGCDKEHICKMALEVADKFLEEANNP
jgi:hypothetical protein